MMVRCIHFASLDGASEALVASAVVVVVVVVVVIAASVVVVVVVVVVIVVVVVVLPLAPPATSPAWFVAVHGARDMIAGCSRPPLEGINGSIGPRPCS